MYITHLPIISLYLQYRHCTTETHLSNAASYSWWFISRAYETGSAMDVTYIVNTEWCN